MSMAVAHIQTSPPMIINGLIWRCELRKEKDEIGMGLFVHVNAPVRASVEFSEITGIKTRHGVPLRGWTPGLPMGWKMLPQLQEALLAHDVVTIKVTVETAEAYLKDVVVQDGAEGDGGVVGMSSAAAQSMLLQKLTEARQAGIDTDIAIAVDGTKFRAHKFWLGLHSPVFRAMFRAPMTESLEGDVLVEGVQAHTFDLLLRFLYSGQCGESVGDADGVDVAQQICDLLLLADRYQIQSAIDYCHAYLMACIPRLTPDVKFVFALLKAADVCRLPDLRTRMEEFVIHDKSLTLEMIRTMPIPCTTHHDTAAASSSKTVTTCLAL
jgi:hypothetical protein